MTQVYDGHRMLDDILRNTAVLRTISAATQQDMIGRTIFVAGQRDVQAQSQPQGHEDGPTDTFEQSESFITEHLGCPPDAADDTNADPLVKQWSKHGVVLISGAESDNEKWLGTGQSAPASERTKGAARQLATELKGESYVLRLGSNFILAKALSEEVPNHPKYVEMINPFCIDDHRLLKPLSHANAVLNAYHAVTSLCQTHEIPMRVLHAQFLGFKVESLNKTPAWSAILKAPLSNIELWRTQTSVNLGLAARLPAQIEAEILHTHDGTYRNEVLLPRYRTLLNMSAPNDYTSSIDEEAQIVAKLPWAADSMRVEHYTREIRPGRAAPAVRRWCITHKTRATSPLRVSTGPWWMDRSPDINSTCRFVSITPPSASDLKTQRRSARCLLTLRSLPLTWRCVRLRRVSWLPWKRSWIT